MSLTKELWIEFIIETNIKEDIKKLAESAVGKGRLTGKDILELIEKYAIEFKEFKAEKVI